MKLTVFVMLCAASVLAGCGGQDAAPKTVTVTAASTASTPAPVVGEGMFGGDTATETPESTTTDTSADDTTSDSASTDDSGEGPGYNANTALALSRGYMFITNYCVHALGAQIGERAAPTSAERKRKNVAIATLGYLARDHPTGTFGDKSLLEWAQQAEESLASGKCDPAGAQKVQRIYDKIITAGG